MAVLINNAGIAPEKAFINGDLKDEEIEKTYAVNALALYWVSSCVFSDALLRGVGSVWCCCVFSCGAFCSCECSLYPHFHCQDLGVFINMISCLVNKEFCTAIIDIHCAGEKCIRICTTSQMLKTSILVPRLSPGRAWGRPVHKVCEISCQVVRR